MTEWIGHILGAIAIGLFFVSYQVVDKRRLILIQTAATALMTLQYLLIGAFSGFALNIVCITRNAFFYYRDRKFFSWKYWPYVFAVIAPAVGLLSWEGYHSLLLAVGLAINTICLGVCSSQTLRKSILLTCTLVIIYNVIEGSYMGIVSESISMVSAIIGLVRYAKAKKAA